MSGILFFIFASCEPLILRYRLTVWKETLLQWYHEIDAAAQHAGSHIAPIAIKVRWGGTRMARGSIRLVHGLTKSTLITYYSGMKKDPKYAFLHAFFLICLSYS